MSETMADIVREITPGMWVWFSSADGEGFRLAKHVQAWFPEYNTFEYDLAREWVTVTYADGHVEHRPRYCTHEVWLSGDRPEFQPAPA